MGHLKKMLVVCLLLVMATPNAYAAGKGWTTSVKDAIKQSKKTGLPILAEFTGSDWCPPCKMLKRDVFSKPEFMTWAKKNVILLELDFPRGKKQSDELKKQNRGMSTKYKIRGFPSILLIGADGKELHREVGYVRGGPKGFAAKFQAKADSYKKSNKPAKKEKRKRVTKVKSSTPCVNDKCLVSGEALEGKGVRGRYDGVVYGLCCKKCFAKFKKSPTEYIPEKKSAKKSEKK